MVHILVPLLDFLPMFTFLKCLSFFYFPINNDFSELLSKLKQSNIVTHSLEFFPLLHSFPHFCQRISYQCMIKQSSLIAIICPLLDIFQSVNENSPSIPELHALGRLSSVSACFMAMLYRLRKLVDHPLEVLKSILSNISHYLLILRSNYNTSN